MPLSIWAYLACFVVSLGTVLLLTPLVLRFAHAREVLDRPGDYKIQDSPVPYLGGVAIVAGFSAVVIGAALMYPPASGLSELAIIFSSALVLSFVGLLDDLKGLSPAPRFVAEIVAGGAIWAVGVRVEVFGSDFLNLVLTLIWIVGITNAFNLLDNMDGLSAGLASIAAGFMFVQGVLNDQYLVAALSIALAGCALGFLKHNFHPARIYMGDAGSLFLGFMLAVLGLKLKSGAPVQIGFMVPVLILGVAILDTSLVLATRIANGFNPFSGGRDHISHRLVFVGVPVRAAVALVYAAGIAVGWLSLVMMRLDIVTGFILMGFVVAVAGFAGVMLGLVPVYERSRRRRMMLMEVVPHEAQSEPPKEDITAEVGGS